MYFLLFTLLHLSYGKDKKLPPLKNKSSIQIAYQNRQWNKSSTDFEAATIAVKDAKSGKIVLIQLQESEPDSSLFTGYYNINMGKIERYLPSIYVPNQDDVKTQAGKQKFIENIRNGKLQRKPFVLKKEGFQQLLEVFDNRKMALKAIKDYRRKRAFLKSQKILKDEELAEAAQLETANNIALAKRLIQLNAEASERQKIRLQSADVERKRLDSLRKDFSNLTAAEQTNRRNQAKSKLQQAFSLFESGKFSDAEKIFWQAIELDPTDNKNLYNYAVNLFRTEKYNDALIYFFITTDKDIDKTEKIYYIGSAHYKLAEFPFAEENFNITKNSANKNLSGSSAFYLGLIQFQRQNFNLAKAEFEFVLDNSIDPELDEQAERYIELIQIDQKFAEARLKPYHASLSVGLNHDSNILLQPDGTASGASATDDGGLRFQLVGSLEYKPVYNRETEWGIKSSVAYIYSLDSKFTEADPFSLSLSSPYKKNSKAFDKSYRWELEPGVEILFMDIDEEGSRENILNSFFVNWKNSFVMNENLISSFNLQTYMNDSKLDVVSGDDDASSFRYALTYNNIYMLDRMKGKILISDVIYSVNDADGKNYAYSRFDLAATYIQPLNLWDLSLTSRLGYYQADYESADNRRDKNLSANIGFIRSLNDWLSWNASLAYTDNQSSVENKEYDRMVIGTNVVGKWNF